MSKVSIAKGLEGVYIDTTELSKVFEDTNTLTYRGYPVDQLAEYCCFEEVAYLLWYGDLPTTSQLQDFQDQERSQRVLSLEIIDLLKKSKKSAHPMDVLRTAVSFLGLQDSDADDSSLPANLRKSIRLFAQIPLIVATQARLAHGQDPIIPRTDLSFSDHFFYMYFGSVPDSALVRCFDASLTFYAEHGFNASTFVARAIASSLSDMHSAITGAIGSLKGPLHGGANEAVMHMLLDIKTPENVLPWLESALKSKEARIMGFGHRVYKKGDSRVPHMNTYFHRVASLCAGERWVEIEKILAHSLLERKGIYPNLDFPVGPTYYLMGFDIPIFTPIFVISRITGWTAHFIEQLRSNKLMRPLSLYNGQAQRSVKRIEKR